MRKFSQMAAAAMGMAKGTSADRPNNPAVGDQFVNGTLGITEVYTENDGWQPLTSSSTGIPFGATADRPDNDLGQPFFNGEEARLELFTSGTGWQNIVQETPGVVSVVGRYIESTPSTTLTINGSNFTSGSIASVIGQDGTEIIADATQIVSVAELAATFSGLSSNNEPYDVKVLNPSNLYGIAFDILQVDDIPVFITQSGSLGTYIEESPMSVQISATDEENQSLTFSISEGSLPAGLSLNAATGEISGTPTDVITDTTSTFEISATDGNNTVARNFSITITDLAPVWQTPQLLPEFSKGIAYSENVLATNDNGVQIVYSLYSGSLPVGLSLNSTTAEIAGTPSSSEQVVFTLRATDTISSKFSDRQFVIPNTGPTWAIETPPSIGAETNSFLSYQLEATDDAPLELEYSVTQGSLISGLSLSNSGRISGTVPDQDGLSESVTIRATDVNGNFAETVIQLKTLRPAATFSISNPPNSYVPGDIINIPYSGSVQSLSLSNILSFQAELTAGGGTDGDGSSRGGRGATVSGEVAGISASNIYVAIGGAGQRGGANSGGGPGGFNGGGAAISDTNTSWTIAGGGGASHIATADGQLSGLVSNKSSVILVAGGGGAGSRNGGVGRAGPGNYPEGVWSQEDGGNGNGSNANGRGGSQTSGGIRGQTGRYGGGNPDGSFGQGGSYSGNNILGGGGGGGWYGGGAGSYHMGLGGGGSSYYNSQYVSSFINTNNGNGTAQNGSGSITVLTVS